MELASTIAGSHRFLPGFIARQKQRQHEFRIQTLVWGLKECLRPFYLAFYRSGILTVHQYIEHQNLDPVAYPGIFFGEGGFNKFI
jgi:hypothetical protein